MRRKEKEIMDRERINWVISQAQVFRLGLSKDDQPYIVPLSFGYDGEVLYFHTAQVGMKLEYLESNPQVCFEVEHEVHLVRDQKTPCNWSQSFYSVVGFGVVNEITDEVGKVEALNQIVNHYEGIGNAPESEAGSKKPWEFDMKLLKSTRVWGISIQEISGKQSPDKIAK